MPQQNSKAINARRFAALLAGCDTDNPSDEEAVSKFRALRHIADDADMRIVDAMEMPEIRQAIDDQMRPVRRESHELQKVMQEASALREELTARTRDVRKLADLLAQQPARQDSHELQEARREAAELREKLTARTRDVRVMSELLAKKQSTQAARSAPVAASAASRVSGHAAPGFGVHSFGAQSWVIEVGVVMLALALLYMNAIR